jgi:flagellar basal-body rod modification protein FlgD
MSVDFTPITITSKTDYTKIAEDKTQLDTNDFFQILAAQLRNQTMYDNMDSTEYISQMAQFSTLSQMQELASNIQKTYAISMIGKGATVAVSADSGSTSYKTGVVENVSYQSSVPYVCIDGGYYELSQIVQIKDAPAQASAPAADDAEE